MLEILFIGLVLIILYITYKWYRYCQLLPGNNGDKYVFITGCDTGFGFMLTKRLDSLGFKVFPGCLTERGMDNVKNQTSNNIIPVQIDVTKQASIDQAFTFVKSKLPPNKGLWGLVNNAGIAGAVGPVDWLSREDYDVCLAVNLFGMIDVTKTFLPLIRDYRGRIVNITSMMGRIAAAPCPYVVSKFGAEGYCDVLRRDLYYTGTTVHILEPGFFATNIAEPNSVNNSIRKTYENLPLETKEYYGQEYVDNMTDSVKRLLNHVTSTKTEKVVNAYVHALTAKYPKYRYVVGVDANTVFRMLWTVPEWLSDLIITCTRPKPKGHIKQ